METTNQSTKVKKFKYVGSVAIILIVIIISFVYHFTKGSKPVIVFKDNAQLEQYTYLSNAALQDAIDLEKSNFGTYHVEFLKDSKIVDPETIRQEQIQLYTTMHNIPYPFPEGYDDKGIMDLLDNGDEIPVVGDLEMRFIASFSNGEEASFEKVFKAVDTIPPKITYRVDDKEVESGARIVVQTGDNEGELRVTDTRFDHDIEIQFNASKSPVKEATQLKIEASDGVNETQYQVYLDYVDLENVSEEMYQILKNAGVINLDRIQVKES
ncbi:hypothetical protein EEI45_02975 [Erysipelothrix piscisicarius]|uniref:Uncharacterized protein n=1 Tax=Erysipelothrix piscisicarius TaxID=2485784 RepID=A0A3Q8S777_9FIRM|nr:hypothetical protein [Erysipelothrix piscisicarius]AZK43881.1 hypothetical protein EEI45_02975 [Erysipelothrix piscisicarius]